MSELDPYDRLEHKGAIDPIMERVCDTYELGDYAGFEVIPVGYEDFNVRLRTDRSDYFVKVFASERTAEEIERFDTIMRAVMRSDVRYPRVVSLGDEVIHTDRQSQLQMVVMEYVEGQTFFDMKRLPTEEETDQILRQAALINQINLKPAPLFDSWAIPNIERQYGLVRQHLSVEERTEVEEIIDTYNQVDHEALPHCFVHGDITKSNTIKSEDGTLYVIDFSVANWYPRIQEIAVIVGNLLSAEGSEGSLLEILKLVVTKYVEQGGILMTEEMEALPAYVRAAYAMEFIGASVEKHVNNNDSEENEYWRNLGWSGIKRALL